MNTAVLQELDQTQRVIDRWYQQSSANLQASYSNFKVQLRQLEERLLGDGVRTSQTHTTLVDSLLTPDRPSFHGDGGSPAMASPPLGRPPLNYEGLFDEGTRDPNRVHADGDAAPGQRLGDIPPSDRSCPCKVLVQFKRQRTVMYESSCYVARGEYVVVGGDRGEDIGCVTHSWTADEAKHISDQSWAEGVGTVLRIASVLEVTQLQGVQAELENRAVEVAQEKVQEHALPMRIVDAEYQFDRRKLTFYYQSQHRLDFRNLVRDLFKTFRARIWMEQDGSS